jgi:hypothetical protein
VNPFLKRDVNHMLPSPTRSINETVCPVSDATLSLLYKADETEVLEIARSLAPDIRAELAVYCFGRAHLREHGRQLAAACATEELSNAGPLGKWLAEMPPEVVHATRKTSKVTLATARYVDVGGAAPSPFVQDVDF